MFSNPRLTRADLAGLLREESQSWLYVFKTALAAYLTCWIAMRVALPQPSTAMLTVVIVMHKQTGLVLAKSFYRIVGTLVGALAAVGIVSLFAQQRELYLLAMALWLGACAGGSTLYRNFQSYGFVLSGYTAALIAIPTINAPQNLFDAAMARVSEVILGIVVAAVVSGVIAPQRTAPALLRIVRERSADLVATLRGLAAGDTEHDAHAFHQRMAREAVAFEDMRAHAFFEDAEFRAFNSVLRSYNFAHMHLVTSIQLFANTLRRLGKQGRDAELAQLRHGLAELASTLESAGDAVPDVDTAPPAAATMATPASFGARQFASMTKDARTYQELAQALITRRKPRVLLRPRFERGYDLPNALLTAFRTTATMLVLSALWVLTAWPSGLSAVLVATIISALFASAPRPTEVARQVLIGTFIGSALGLVCEFGVLAQVDGFVLLVACSLPFFLTACYPLTRPAYANLGFGCIVALVSQMSIRNPMVFAPASYLNEGIAQLFGYGLAAAAFMVLPTAIGSERLHRRFVRNIRRQLRMAATAPLQRVRQHFESRTRDLLIQAMLHAATNTSLVQAATASALSVHEMGRLIIALRVAAPQARRGATREPALWQRIARFYESPSATNFDSAHEAIDRLLRETNATSDAGVILEVMKATLEDEKAVGSTGLLTHEV